MEFKTQFESQLVARASKLNKTIVLPEAGYSKTVYEAGILADKNKIANIIFLVKEDNELLKFGNNVSESIKVVNINTSELLPILINALVIKRQSKGLTYEQANELLKNEIYFATMMVELNLADGMVCGAENTTANSIRPALQIIKGKNPDQVISSFFIMVSENESFGEDGVFVLSDCGINENPTAQDLCQIVFDTVASARQTTNITPKVALLSYSTLGSAEGSHPTKMREAKQFILQQQPNFVVDGEMQLDASIVPAVAAKKAPNSMLKGEANILIFPDLSSGNISYKLMQRLGGFTAIGPICQGFNKPVNDVSRGANPQEIALTIAITALQAE